MRLRPLIAHSGRLTSTRPLRARSRPYHLMGMDLKTSGKPIVGPGNETKAAQHPPLHAGKRRDRKVIQILRHPGKSPLRDSFLRQKS